MNYFSHGQWVAAPLEESDLEVLAADSFVVDQGHAVGFRRHLDRFRQAVEDSGAKAGDDLDSFLDQAIAEIPLTGRWFPRIDLVTNSDATWWRYHHRAAPPTETKVRLAVAPHDPREKPWRKGPDLKRMGQLRESVADIADEALIVSGDGTVVEGAYSSIVVIDPQRREASITPREHLRIPSVTEQIVTECLTSEGFSVSEQAHTIESLAGHEVWILSALHGIRVATEIHGGPALKVDMARRDTFQPLWLSQAEAIDAWSG